MTDATASVAEHHQALARLEQQILAAEQHLERLRQERTKHLITLSEARWTDAAGDGSDDCLHQR
jgi:GAF domain-containing protein